ncbi:MAG: phytanoyl-CoA dioxygenase family protein [Oculatellaceae cyanobacterium bins.114]|nr:phytanoyl-CoA dioxygenase family protein [Oculatellaceae cyanobacterium bins.114]
MPSPLTHLTSEQVTQFHEDGFLIIEDLLDQHLVNQLVNRVDPLFAGEFETGVYPDEWHWNPYLSLPGASGQMTGVWKCDRTLASVMLSSGLGQICAALGNWSGARVLVDGLWRKPYGASETTLHQDSMYSFYHTPQDIVIAWIALSDAVHGAGTIEYVRGSHKWPLSQTVGEFHAVNKSYRSDMEQAAERAGISHPEVLQLELKPGSCAFHHGHMWHGSGKNTTPGKLRQSLVVACIPAESRFKPAETYVPGGYIAGRYKQYGSDAMDESFFPILWTQDGYRTPFLADYCEDGLPAAPALVALA